MEGYITVFYLVTVGAAIILSYALEKEIAKKEAALEEVEHQRARSLEWQEKYFEIKRRHAKIMDVLQQPKKDVSTVTTNSHCVGTSAQVPTK